MVNLFLQAALASHDISANFNREKFFIPRKYVQVRLSPSEEVSRKKYLLTQGVFFWEFSDTLNILFFKK